MATELSGAASEVRLLHDYLGKALAGNAADLTLDEALTGFQEYYLQRRDLRAKVQEAEESLARGEGRPLDVVGVISRVRRRLAAMSHG